MVCFSSQTTLIYFLCFRSEKLWTVRLTHIGHNLFTVLPTLLKEISDGATMRFSANPRWSEARWRHSWNGVQQQYRRNSSVTSTGHRACLCLWEKGQVKEICLQIFLEGSNWNGWTDRQRGVVPKRWSTRVKSSCTCDGLDSRDRQTNTFVRSQWMGWEWCGKHRVKINRLFFMQGFVGQHTDPEQFSQPYWQPMKWTKQWNTVSKWRWLCHNASHSILNTLKFGEISVCNTIQKWIAIMQMTGHKSKHKQCCAIQIKVKITANTLQIPRMVKAWVADCRYMWAEGEIFVKYHSKIPRHAA